LETKKKKKGLNGSVATCTAMLELAVSPPTVCAGLSAQKQKLGHCSNFLKN
jgi:hypothetical protein